MGWADLVDQGCILDLLCLHPLSLFLEDFLATLDLPTVLTEHCIAKVLIMGVEPQPDDTVIDQAHNKEAPNQADSINNDPKKTEDRDGKQIGVQKVEAAASVWPKWHLIAAYAKFVTPMDNDDFRLLTLYSQ